MNKRVAKLLRARTILRERIAKLDHGVFNIDDALMEYATEVYARAVKKPDATLESGNREEWHECEPSPIQMCAYDTDEDPDWNECVFCKQPWLR